MYVCVCLIFLGFVCIKFFWFNTPVLQKNYLREILGHFKVVWKC